MKKIFMLIVVVFFLFSIGCSSGSDGGGNTENTKTDTTKDTDTTVPLSSKKAITAFSFASPTATGVITEATHTIAITVPYGTNVKALVAIFTTTGVSVKVGSAAQKTGTTVNDFTNPVVYTVTAQDNTTQNYTVTVTVVTPSSEKEITAFSFTSPVATGVITEATHTIAITVPYGTNVKALVAKFTTTGVSVKVGSAAQKTGTTVNDFTNPVVYTVTAQDNTTQNYTVTVTVVAPLSKKEITAFFLKGVRGTIDKAEKTIAVTMPFGTDVTALVVTFTITGVSVKVGSTAQKTGTTVNDFTSPVVYTVTAQDATTQDYTVTVRVAGPSISGNVSGTGSGVEIILSGDSSSTTTTNSIGNYSFGDVANGSYTITPSSANYFFSPSDISVTMSDANITGQDFTATNNYIGSYYGTMKVVIFSGGIRIIINEYSETSISGTIEDLKFGYGVKSITSGYISGNSFHAEGSDGELTVVADGTFSWNGLALSGNFNTSDGHSGTITATKE